MATRRIQKDLQTVVQQPIDNVTMTPSESDILHWDGVLTGPSNSPYESAKFKFTITFPTDYPFKPPNIKFVTRIYHPNIDESGAICLGLLKSDAWKPSTSILTVLSSLVSLLAEPNPADPLETRIAEIYQSDRKQFDRTVKEWIKRYC
ncbi:ubiquitin-conjugating enzyme/RWD-like protein [Gorgonomyces haynaldii]|nr:ubiquitin-conjugating enzyme/RWD-like protein [Gorgonomyces haynaldii]